MIVYTVFLMGTQLMTQCLSQFGQNCSSGTGAVLGNGLDPSQVAEGSLVSRA